MGATLCAVSLTLRLLCNKLPVIQTNSRSFCMILPQILRLRKGAKVQAALPRPGHFMFLNMPTGRRYQWHPVTVANVEVDQPNTALVTAHMKCYRTWTSVRTSAGTVAMKST